MGAVAFALLSVFNNRIGISGFIHEILLVGICAGGSITVFMLVAYGLNIEEWRWLSSLIRRRLGL
jgi:hypothetical protein